MASDLNCAGRSSVVRLALVQMPWRSGLPSGVRGALHASCAEAAPASASASANTDAPIRVDLMVFPPASAVLVRRDESSGAPPAPPSTAPLGPPLRKGNHFVARGRYWPPL